MNTPCLIRDQSPIYDGQIRKSNRMRNKALPFREVIRNNDSLKGSAICFLVFRGEHFLSGIEIDAILAVNMKVAIK